MNDEWRWRILPYFSDSNAHFACLFFISNNFISACAFILLKKSEFNENFFYPNFSTIFLFIKNSNRAMNWINMSWLIGYLHTCLMFRIWGTAHNTTTIRKQSQVKSENPKSPISKHPSQRRDYKTQEKINYVVACN